MYLVNSCSPWLFARWVLALLGGGLQAFKRNNEVAKWQPILLLLFLLYRCHSLSIWVSSLSRKEDDKAIADKVARDTKINIKLDDISGDVKEIRYDFSETKKQVADMDKRLVVVEQSAKAAHHRLDDFIGKADRADAE